MELTDMRDPNDIKNFYIVSMILFALINRVIDLGDEIVTSGTPGVPGTYR